MTFGQLLNSQFAPTQQLELILRILLAAVLGLVIGVERSRRFKEAGVRTHVIVCAAAALMMIVSKYGFADLGSAANAFPGTRGADPARVAAQVVSGISFLGAGVIFKNGSNVKGLTTAAGVWATAGIGLAVGAGFYGAGLFLTLLVAALQILMHRFPLGGDSYSTYRLRLRINRDEQAMETLNGWLKGWQARAVENRVKRCEDGSLIYEISLRLPRELSDKELMDFAAAHEEILEISSNDAE